MLFSIFVSDLVASEDLAEEFHRKAPPAWHNVRKKLFHDQAIEVTLRVRDSYRREGGDHEYQYRYRQYAKNNFKYYDAVLQDANYETGEGDLNRRRVTGFNPQYRFALEETATSNWQVTEVELDDQGYAFDAHETDPAARDRLDNGIIKNISGVFGNDPRMTIRRDMLIEDFYAQHRDWFVEFSERDDPLLGRIVIASIRGEITKQDLTPEQIRSLEERGSSANRSTQVTGSMEFLADHDWVPSTIDVERTLLDSDGKELRRAKEVLVSQYDTSDPKLPTKVVQSMSVAPTNQRLEKNYTIREFTDDEIAAAQQACYLSAYGIGEPAGLKRSWPLWIWVTVFGVVLVVASAWTFVRNAR